MWNKSFLTMLACEIEFKCILRARSPSRSQIMFPGTWEKDEGNESIEENHLEKRKGDRERECVCVCVCVCVCESVCLG